MDRWSFRPALVAIVAVTLVTLLIRLPGWLGFILVPLSALVFSVAALTLVGAAISLAIKRRPRRAISFVLAAIMPILLWFPLLRLSDYPHLALTAWFGAGVLGGPLNHNEKGFRTYDWSVGLVTNPDTILIRDESDQVALPAAQIKNVSGFKKDVYGWCAGTSQHLVGHYYVCDFE